MGHRLLGAFILALATSGCGLFDFSDPPAELFWSGGTAFSARNPLLEAEGLIWDISSDRPASLELTITRCSDAPDFPPQRGEYTDWYRESGDCIAGGNTIPAEGVLNATDVGIDLWWECGDDRSDTVRTSLSVVAESRMEGRFEGSDDTCAGRGEETGLWLRYWRASEGQYLQFHVQGTYFEG